MIDLQKPVTTRPASATNRAYPLLIGREFDFNLRGLQNYLRETCTLTGERFPEYDEWLATEK